MTLAVKITLNLSEYQLGVTLVMMQFVNSKKKKELLSNSEHRKKILTERCVKLSSSDNSSKPHWKHKSTKESLHTLFKSYLPSYYNQS